MDAQQQSLQRAMDAEVGNSIPCVVNVVTVELCVLVTCLSAVIFLSRMCSIVGVVGWVIVK